VSKNLFWTTTPKPKDHSVDCCHFCCFSPFHELLFCCHSTAVTNTTSLSHNKHPVDCCFCKHFSPNCCSCPSHPDNKPAHCTVALLACLSMPTAIDTQLIVAFGKFFHWINRQAGWMWPILVFSPCLLLPFCCHHPCCILHHANNDTALE